MYAKLYIYIYIYNADDIIVFKSFKITEVSHVTTIINNDFKLISEWSEENGLHLNPAKSSFLIAGSSQLRPRLQSFDININHISL